jgi:hypothetical protein
LFHVEAEVSAAHPAAQKLFSLTEEVLGGVVDAADDLKNVFTTASRNGWHTL